MLFKQFLENQLDQIASNPVVYHTTYLRNLDDIFKSKLVPRGGTSAWQKPHLHQHSEKGVFFCKDLNCAKRWAGEMMEQAFNLSDNPTEEGFIPVIVKFRLNKNSWRPDKLGSLEVHNSYYTPKNINPLGIQIWDGHKWSNDPDDAENLRYNWQDDDDYSDYPYPTN